ncbi:hypothetical protein B0T16DRAFT_429470 [Cercophora newfieldiana]|uniref:Synaptobrevin n=1 Tax=Cercophora newfieldiana TaxID=92897 RepID=A0AA39Y783_9PEZI|nr:hypothetical protein B0T16DRAFT_429470 [Cercophora newfieldiana]
MARLVHGVAISSPVSPSADTLTELNRLLNRLQQTILRADAEHEARLRANEYERERVQQNVRHAQSLLTKLEQEALYIKIHSRRQELQSDLVRKRETLDQIFDRINDLAEIAATSPEDDDADGGDTSEGEDILADIIATPSESLDSSRSPEVSPKHLEENEPPSVDPIPSLESAPPAQPPREDAKPTHQRPPSPPALSEKPEVTTTTSQTLRPRRHNPSEKEPTTGSTTSSALFGDRSAAATTNSATTEAILDHQRAEQDAISESILKLASDLKASSHAFTATLEEDKEVVDRAGQGMNKTGERMDAVTQRMGLLQRMTEGEGWWGRMRLYVQVYGLMVVLVLLVFVLPKLRF